MRAAVIHSSLNPAGGGERVALAFIEALRDLGYAVDLVTMEPTDWGRIERLVGRAVRPDRELTLVPFEVRAFAIYARMLTSLRLLLRSRGYDLVVNTHGDMMPLRADIVYMHFPTFALLLEQPENRKYAESLFWRVYFEPYRLAQSLLVRLLRNHSVVLLTNSEFSREAVRRHVGRDAVVVYPPVDLSGFREAGESLGGREDVVVSCGRFTPEKRYEFILQVASRLPDVEFHIIGARSGTVTAPYISRLERLREKLRLGNVWFHLDLPRDSMIKLYSRAKVYMHAMIGEHFGISVVEGMAAGLVPVVHRSGGPWYDILDRGRYGLGYETLDEAVEAVEKAIRWYGSLAPAARARSLGYSWDKFVARAKRVVEAVMRW